MTVQANIIEKLKEDFNGDILLKEDLQYDGARTIWNAMIDKHPQVIGRCETTSDVVACVNFAREHQLLLAVRGGGHNIAGNAICDDGMVIDLSRMRSVRVDAQTRKASVEGGALLADFDAAAQEHGLATPLGINSTTGVAGLTLGGGFGWLSRKYGMTVDNLDSAEVVLASGKVVEASDTNETDLFWAIRGGGGNFGVVTRFVFRLHPVGPQVFTGLIVFPLLQAKRVLQRYREFIANAPDELTVWAVLRKAPPLPFLPTDAHGSEILALAVLYAGDVIEGEALVKPLREFGTPLGEHFGVQPYVDWQKTFDPLLAPGARNYWKSHNFSTLSDELFDEVIRFIGTLPSAQCEIFFGAIGGATTRLPSDATAYAFRDAKFVMNVHGRWDVAADDQVCIQWARDFFKASAPYASAGVYVNFLTADEKDRVRAAYGPNYDRLARIKKAVDPQNLFRVNQNIAPIQ